MNGLDFDIIVAGGGAAGMMAAIKGAEAGCSVALLEKNPFCGKKINITGKGRCNVTNNRPWAEFAPHIHPVSDFFRPAFYHFSNSDTMAFFESIGLPLVETQGKRIFPASMRAADVSGALVRHMEQLGVNIFYECELLDVVREGEFLFCGCIRRERGMRHPSAERFRARALIVATGGLSYPATGSTGAGYDIAASFGHEIVPTFPSLTALRPWRYNCDLEGIDLENVALTLLIDGDIAGIEQGDLSFTNAGIEGPIGYRLSRRAVGAMIKGQKVELLLDLKPALTKEKLVGRIARETDAIVLKNGDAGPLQLKRIISRLMPAALVAPFIEAHPSLTLKTLPGALKEWPFKIASYTGYERAVVTAGGVSRKEVVAKTLRSKRDSALYFAGEVLDLDGDTGGYNLQIAFSTGALAGERAAQQILKERDASS